MNLETKHPQFNGLTNESPIESLIYRTVCCPPGFTMEAEDVRTFWNTMEPQAGQSTQIIWLADDIDRASRLVRSIAPHSQIRTGDSADPNLRAVIVATAAERLRAMRIGQQFSNAVFISASGLEDFDGSLAIRSPRLHEPEINLYVIGSFVQASATCAAVVAAYMTKHRASTVTQIQTALMHSASRSNGYPALRRI